MLTGNEDVDSQVLISNQRYRQFYLSFDLNLNGVNTKSRVLKSIFDVLNMIKIPFPTLEFNKKGAVFHLFYY